MNSEPRKPVERDATAAWAQPAKTWFEADAQEAQRRYEESRRRHRELYPVIPRSVIEANAKPAKIMTPEELIAAGAHLYIKGS